MPKGKLRRGFIGVASPLVVIAFLLASTVTASAHEVTDITTTCETVTVSFSGFPQSGVTVHITATVEGHGTLSKDVVVNDTTTQALLDISSATNALFGATANVDVDVTWTFQGPQHVHKTLSATCGTATTTTPPPSSTTTLAPTTSTTMVSVSGETSTSIEHQGTTSTTSAEVVVSGNTTSTTTSAVLGASATVSPAAASPTGSNSSLPFTGSDTSGLVILGLAALGAGTGIVITQRRRSATS